jgi:ABC-type Mn2+/Zn2+ transport system ATPase subunit
VLRSSAPVARTVKDSLHPAVDLNNVTVHYGDFCALQGANASAPRASFTCLVGANGSGKTTLLKAILGTVTASGQIHVLGDDDHRRRRREVGYVPQRSAANWRRFPVSVLDAVLMGKRETVRAVGWTWRRNREAALHALDQVGMAGDRDQVVGRLSGGKQQRVALARVLFSGARVLLLDEPLAGVDPPTRKVVLDLLGTHCKEGGGAVLMATHDVNEAVAIADRVWGIRNDVVFEGLPGQLRDQNVLRAIYGERLVVLHDGQAALGP